VSCTEQPPLDPKGTIVYESILLQHLLHISTTEAWDFNSRCSDRCVGLLILVAFSFFTFQFLQQFFLGASKVLFYSVQLQSIFCWTLIDLSPMHHLLALVVKGDRLWNDLVFIWSHILRNAHQVLLQTVSSIYGNFMKHFLFQLLDCFIIKHSVKFLSVFGGHLVSWNTPPRKEGSSA
jgi:hypothetical protein